MDYYFILMSDLATDQEDKSNRVYEQIDPASLRPIQQLYYSVTELFLNHK